MKIIYQQTDGSVAVITPAPNCSLTDAQTAAKDVPTGSAYKIVADDYVPSDRTFRNAWTIDSAILTDGVGD
tara:strand:- start:36 stop:248 length:213 start_codon:yes stop_codon:yes gene_type:complete